MQSHRLLGVRDEGNNGMLFHRYKIQFCEMERVLEMYGSDGCTIM